jgi:hypothetical protein
MILQLTERLAVETLGSGYAILVEPGEDDQWWTVALHDTCALVTFRQSQLRVSRSYTGSMDISDKQMRGIIAKAVKP